MKPGADQRALPLSRATPPHAPAAPPCSSHALPFAMFEITAYCDESESAHQVHALAGYWAAAKEWERFEAAWNAELAAVGLTEFHAADCEHGKGEFAGRRDRLTLPGAFIDIINQFDVNGVWCAIDLRGWDEVAHRVAELRAEHRMENPYYVSFQQLMETIALAMLPFPTNERLALVFDERPDHGKVKLLYDSLKATANPELTFVARRLGSITYGDSGQLPGLQAADLLAYEVRKHFVEVDYGITSPTRPRPEWRKLWSRPMRGQHIPQDRIPVLMEAMERDWGESANRFAEDREKARAARAARSAAAARARRLPSGQPSPEASPPEEPS
jgi:hypothetical protein